MGMYDYIKCDMPLEGNPPIAPDGGWQTKDTPDQYLTTYTIREDGTLWWRPYEIYTVPKKDRPYPDDDGLMGLCGSMGRKFSEPEQLSDFHGDIHFYAEDKDKNGWEYRARFTEGVCKITLVDSPTPLADSAEQEGVS